MNRSTFDDAIRKFQSIQDNECYTVKFRNYCAMAITALREQQEKCSPDMLSLEELLSVNEEPVYIWFCDAPGRWVIRPSNAWIDSCTPERMTLFQMKWYLHSRYGIDWKAYRTKPVPEKQQEALEKCCQTCSVYAPLKEPYRRKDGAIIYGYCFADAQNDNSPNLGRGYPVYIDGGGCVCKKYIKNLK